MIIRRVETKVNGEFSPLFETCKKVHYEASCWVGDTSVSSIHPSLLVAVKHFIDHHVPSMDGHEIDITVFQNGDLGLRVRTL